MALGGAAGEASEAPDLGKEDADAVADEIAGPVEALGGGLGVAVEVDGHRPGRVRGRE